MTFQDRRPLRVLLADFARLSDLGPGDGWAWLEKRLAEPELRGLGAQFFAWQAHGGAGGACR